MACTHVRVGPGLERGWLSNVQPHLEPLEQQDLVSGLNGEACEQFGNAERQAIWKALRTLFYFPSAHV